MCVIALRQRCRDALRLSQLNLYQYETSLKLILVLCNNVEISSVLFCNYLKIVANMIRALVFSPAKQMLLSQLFISFAVVFQ